MIINVDFSAFQKALKDLKSIVSKSPLASSDDAKELGGLITADDSTGSIKIELAVKGFYLSSVVPGEIQEPGSVVVRVDSVTSLKTSVGLVAMSCGPKDKTLKLKSGKFKADIPINHDVNDIVSQRPDKIITTHSVASTKLSSALKCVHLESASKDDSLFAKFVFNASGFSVWSNGPSTAAIYRNVKSAFDEELEVILPVDFIVAFLSKVTGKVQLAVDESSFQLTSDEIDVSHPLRDSEVFDVKSAVEEIVSDQDCDVKFTSTIEEVLEALNSISSFAPEDSRMSFKVDPAKGVVVCRTASPSGEGENSFSATEIESIKNKTVECFLNNRVVTKLVESIKYLNSEEVTWYIISDRIVIQGKDGSASYICAHME